MDTYKEFCIRFWESTRHLDLYSMDGTQLDRLIVDALSKTNGGGELIKTSMNELSVLINTFNHNNRKIQPPSPLSELDETARKYEISIGSQDYCYMDIEDAFKAGAEWMKEQIMEKAVEADVNTYKDLATGKSWAKFVVKMPTSNLGDKVRIIIVKEE